MSRPLRVQFPGALYHVTARGNARAQIALDDEDRLTWLEVLAKAVERYGLVCYAYCLLGNNFHLLLETPRANLASAMQRLCSVYALASTAAIVAPGTCSRAVTRRSWSSATATSSN